MTNRPVQLLFLAFLLLMAGCQSEPKATEQVPAEPQAPTNPIPVQRHDQIFEKYFEVYPNEVQEVVEGVASKTIQEEAFKLYEQGRYEQAVVLFNEVLRKGLNFDVYFYRGISFLKLGYIEDARGEFSRMITDHKLYHQARWYVALTYIKQNRLTEAKIILKSIIDQPAPVYNQDKAKVLIEEL